MTSTLVILFSVCLSANEQAIEAVQYPDSAAAAKAWTSDVAKLPIRLVQQDGRQALGFPLPFASQPSLPRVSLDRKLQLDLSAVGEFTLDIRVEDVTAAGGISLYFHSGKGWYSGSGGLSKKGWQTLRFSKAGFRVEDEPAGWHQIDSVRVSIWRGQDKDSTAAIGRLTAAWHDVALVVPSARGERRDGEHRAAMETAHRVTEYLADLGLGADAVEEAAVPQGALKNRWVAILAHNPGIDEQVVAALDQFVQQGGKLVVCYQLPPALAKRLGFGKAKYVGQGSSGRFAEMRFDATIPGLPKSVRQASWNITAAQPISDDAQVIARWHDRDGQATGEPAVLVSPRGVFFSHILLADDPAGKRQMLAALLGKLDSRLWQQMAAAALRQTQEIGHLDNWDALAEFAGQAKGTASVSRLLDRAHKTMEAARALVAQQEYAGAVTTAADARRLAAEAYLQAQPSPAREGRAFWNHSGTGAYPGDWERTARELSAAGFNIVIPNMLWAGLAHYESDLLPRSKVVEEHGDQIAQCVAACRKHGLEVHVWKVNHNLSTAPKEFVEKLRQASRLQVSHAGKTLDWLCPSNAENEKLERDSMLEVARKYDVDGLHFDYIRYPDGQHCYCDGCRQRFEAETGRVNRWPQDVYSGARKDQYRTWRARQITRLVETVAREARAMKPKLKISAAVFGSYPDCRESVGQDWVAWVKAGYLDFVCPMDYATSDLQFANLVSNQLKLVEGRIPMYPGIGAWRLGSVDRVVGQIHHARSLGAAGFTVFNLDEGAAQSLLPGIGLGAGKQKAVPPHANR